MSDLKPMVLMVCDTCRDGSTSGEWVPGCAICQGQALVQGDEVAMEETGRGPKPARSRDEMVEAGASALRGSSPTDDLDRAQARLVLAAAIPGLED